MQKSVSWFRVNTLCLGKAALSPHITAVIDPQPQRQENYAFTVDSINQWTSPGVHPSSHIISPHSTLPSLFPSLFVSSGLIMEEESIGFTNTSAIWGRAALAPWQDWQLVMKYEQVISRHPSVCESPKTPCGGGTDVREDLLQLVTCPLPQAASSASQHSLPQPPASEWFFFTELWTCGPTLYWLAAAYGTSSTSGITRNTRRTRDEHDEWNTNPFN